MLERSDGPFLSGSGHLIDRSRIGTGPHGEGDRAIREPGCETVFGEVSRPRSRRPAGGWYNVKAECVARRCEGEGRRNSRSCENGVVRHEAGGGGKTTGPEESRMYDSSRFRARIQTRAMVRAALRFLPEDCNETS